MGDADKPYPVRDVGREVAAELLQLRRMKKNRE